MYQLTKAQIECFYKKGWLGPLNTFSSTEVELVGKQLRAISQVKEIDNFKVLNFYNKYMNVPHLGIIILLVSLSLGCLLTKE